MIEEDTLLGGRVRLLQGDDGYRAAIDPVLLAASIAANKDQRVLDLGCGGGAASLCLAARVAEIHVTGLEMQADLVDLARHSAILNGLDARVSFLAGDILSPPTVLKTGSFDHVMANPPYRPAATGHAPPDPAKRAANVEGAARLSHWIDCAIAMVRPKGRVTFIHRADRSPEILAALNGRLGAITIMPLWPRAGEAAKRVIIQGQKGARAPATIHPGLVLHEPEGAYTAAAQAVLKDAAALAL